MYTKSCASKPLRFLGVCQGLPGAKSDQRLWQEFQSDFLPLREGVLHLAANEEGIDHCPDKSKANFMVNHVEDDRSGDS